MSPFLDEEAVTVNILNSVIHDSKIIDFVVCNYEFDWYAGIILDMSIDNSFYKIHAPKRSVHAI